jgi:beta-1,4-mannosyltransferase
MKTDDVLAIVSGVTFGILWLSLTGFLWYFFKPRNYHSLRSVAILVLGDIGRSPRMMYHAQSFAENGFMTELVGYGGLLPHALVSPTNAWLNYVQGPT